MDNPMYPDHPHFKDLVLFYEYFYSDTGGGIAASHQTCWTGLIAELIDRVYKIKLLALIKLMRQKSNYFCRYQIITCLF